MSNPAGLPNLPDPEALFQSWWPIIIAVVCGTLYAARQYMHGAKCTSQTKLVGKTAIITGGNGSIGFEVALDLAFRGAQVVLACRSEEEGQTAVDKIIEKTNNKKVVAMKCDLMSFDSVKLFVDAFKKKDWPLHILINNAGVMMVNERELSEDSFEKQFQVNYLGAFLLTHLLLDKLKSSSPSRVINTLASAYQLGEIYFDDISFNEVEYHTGRAFAQSKLALALFTKTLSEYLKDTGVTVNAVNPGISNTQIHRHMPFRKNGFLNMSLSPILWFLMQNPEDGAQTTLYCSVAEAEEGKTGQLYKECKVEEWAPVLEDELCKQLWEKSLDWVGCEVFGESQ